MSVDILGTSWDQCRSTVQYCFTSSETRRLVRTDSPAGRPPRLSHSSWTMKKLACITNPLALFIPPPPYPSPCVQSPQCPGYSFSSRRRRPSMKIRPIRDKKDAGELWGVGQWWEVTVCDSCVCTHRVVKTPLIPLHAWCVDSGTYHIVIISWEQLRSVCLVFFLALYLLWPRQV